MSTRKTDSSFESYVYALTEQVEQHIYGLGELSDTLMKRQLSFNERSACERSIQVIVEAAIGCSKHYLKKMGKPVPSESRGSIERVYELLSIKEPVIADMRGAVGMRNAIIHDYLNLNWAKIEQVVKAKKYILVMNYVQKITKELLK